MCLQEAVAIVLDVGPSMTQAPPGEQSHLQVSLEAINMILQRKVCYRRMNAKVNETVKPSCLNKYGEIV